MLRALLKQWVEAYIRTLRPKLLLGRYRAETLDWTKAFNTGQIQIGSGGANQQRAFVLETYGQAQ